jgi:hypothetical protein
MGELKKGAALGKGVDNIWLLQLPDFLISFEA